MASKLATGVIVPVLQTLCSTLSIFVVNISAGNLYAIAYFG
jgi:hypothetical protein